MGKSKSWHGDRKWVPDRQIETNENKTASFQKEAMRTQVALYFFMKWNLYRVVSLCLNKQNVQNRQVEKSLLL